MRKRQQVHRLNGMLAAAAGMAALLLGAGPILAGAAAAKRRHVPSPVPNGFYGGGAIGPRHTRTQSDIQYVNIKADSRARSITFYADASAACQHTKAAANTELVSFYPTGISVHNGHFSATGVTPADGSQGSPNVSYSLSGHFVTAARAVGTMSAHGTFPGANGDVATCTVPRVSFTVTDPKLSIGSGKLVAGAAYYGNMIYVPKKDRTPFVLRVSKDGRHLAQLATEFNYDCTPSVGVAGNGFFQGRVEWPPPPFPIDKHGAFTIHDHGHRAIPGEPNLVGDETVVIHGRFGRYRLSGTWRDDITVSNASTHQVAGSCTTHTEQFQATL